MTTIATRTDLNNQPEMAGRTDTGLVRPNNEDTFAINTQAGYCLVADGMGGAAAGETASRLFAEAAAEIFGARPPADETEAVEKVQNAFRHANKLILEHVDRNPHHKGMGCTAELLALHAGGYVIGHMGDSRTYRFRNGTLKQLTKDHSLVQDQLDRGLISAEEARHHAMRNVVLRAVGVDTAPALDTLRGPVQPGDLFLLCSDGLTDMVTDDAIAEVLATLQPLETAAARLIEIAKQAGGRDNITVAMAKIS